MPHISIASPNNPYSHRAYDTELVRVEELVPDQLRQSSEKFIELIQEYYNYLNTEGLPTYEINRILDEHDIDHMSIKYLDGIQAEIAKSVPESRVMDKISLYRKIVKYYTLKGSEESVTTFFRLFFDEIVKVIYPKDKLFSLSSGDWRVNEDKYVKTIIASRTFGDSQYDYNYTPINFTNASGEVISSAKIVKMEPVNLYDTPPNISNLALDLNSKKRVNTVTNTWDSLIHKNLWRGFFYNDCAYDDSRKSIKFGGKKGYTDFGDIGLQDNVKYDNGEHTFAARVRFSHDVENTKIQPIFSLASDYKLSNSLELYYNRETDKIGRSLEHSNEPYIKSLDNTVVYELSNFTDAASSNLHSYSGKQYTHLHNFFLPITDRLNGNWLQSDVSFNDSPTYVHETETELLNLSRSDLIYYPSEGTKFPDPKFRNVGQDITGLGETKLGWSTSINHDGSILAISAVDENQETGTVRTYKYNFETDSWDQFALTLSGNLTGDRFGERIKLSKDGTRMVVGASHEANSNGDFEAGRIYVYEYNETIDEWEQLGNVIDGLAVRDNWGLAASINDAGTIIVGGAQVYDGVAGRNSGLARVYEYNENTNQWDQLGSNLEGEKEGDIFGRGVDLDSVGHTLVVGTLSSDTPANLSGHVSVFKYDGNDWNQVGQSIYGEGEEDRFGQVVAISADGKTIVGASQFNSDGFQNSTLSTDDPLFRRGHARVYKFNDSLQYWEQVGTDIDGPYAAGQFGVSTDISADATRLVVGSRFYENEYGPDAGVVQMYEFDDRIGDWVKFDDEIVGTGQGQAGYSATISGNGNSIVIGAPYESYASVLGIPNAHMKTLMYREKDGSGNNRWAIRSHSRDVYYTDWYTDQEFETILPDTTKMKWNIGYYYGNDSLPVAADVDAVKTNEKYLFQLHNRGYLTVYKKHRGDYTPWQNITIASNEEFDGNKLWEIVDYDIDGDYLAILDNQIIQNSLDNYIQKSRVVIFKTNNIDEYEFHQTIDFDVSSEFIRYSDFMHLRMSNSKIAVGTQNRGNQSHGQVIRVYSKDENDQWLDYKNIDPVPFEKVKTQVELSGFKNRTSGAWRSINSDLSFPEVSYEDVLVGGYFASSTESVETINYDMIRVGDTNHLSFSLSFKAGSTPIGNVKNILSIGNFNLHIVELNKLRRFYISTGDYSTNNSHLLGDSFSDPLYKNEYNSILEVFNDDRFNGYNVKDEWTNLILDVEFDAITNKIEGVRYSINGFKGSDAIQTNDLDEINVSRNSKVKIYKDITVSSFGLYRDRLNNDKFDKIEYYLQRFDINKNIGINPNLDNGKFEFNESGTVITKVAPTEIFFWKLSEDNWVSYSEKVSSATFTYNPVIDVSSSDDYVRQNRVGSFTYKFFGDVLLLVNGGLNSKYRFNDSFSSFYSYADHHVYSSLYYIKPSLLTTLSDWSTVRKIHPSKNFAQSNDDEFVKRGINFGANLIIDNVTESFAISSETGTSDLQIQGLDNHYENRKTSVRYYVYHKVGDDVLLYRPIFRNTVYPESASYGFYKGRYLAPKYSGSLIYPYLFHTIDQSSNITRYSFNNLTEEYFRDDYELSGDFVISSTQDNEIYSNLSFDQNQYNVFFVKGYAHRYNGYISVSVNGSDFEEIFCGNTLKVLTISEYSNFVLGRNALGYLNGQISHVQYYTRAVSNSTKDEIYEYFVKNVLEFFSVEIDEFEGSAIGVTSFRSLPRAKDRFQYDNLDGHIFNSFWYFEDEATYKDNARIRLTINYNNALTDTQYIYWGDRRKDILSDNTRIIHHYTTDLLGEYVDRKGRVSSINKLQDSNFWQEFSYNLKTSVRVDYWEKEFLNLVHPAGLKFFASVILLAIRNNHWYGPKWVRFDENSRNNVSLITVDSKFLSPYRTLQPIEDLRWLESLVAPNNTGGYHLPIFQPGWLQGDVKIREFIFEAGLWTKMARSVPGNAFTANYTYTYTHGDANLDREIRIHKMWGGDLKVNDRIYQDVEGSLPLYGGITNIGIDGDDAYATVKLLGYRTSVADTPELQRSYTSAGTHYSRLDGLAYVHAISDSDYVTIDLEEEKEVFGLSVQGGSNVNDDDIEFILASNVINNGGEPSGNTQNIAYSQDGSIIAIASPSSGSKVRVYSYDGSTISQIGADITKPTGAHGFGDIIELSGDGNTIAISAPRSDGPVGDRDQCGAVYVYRYDGNNWVSLGNTIYGDSELDQIGYTLSLSNDGDTLSVGSENANVGNVIKTGEIRVYELDNSTWNHNFPSLIGDENDELGTAVLSNDGSNILVKGNTYAVVYASVVRNENIIQNPTEDNRYYTSYHALYNKSELDHPSAWRPSKNQQGDIDNGNYEDVYIQLDLGSVQTITDFITQGETFGGNWVTSYAISHSIDGETYAFIDDGGSNKVFAGNLDTVTKVFNTLEVFIAARYVRIHPISYNGVNSEVNPALRFGVKVNNYYNEWDQIGDKFEGSYDSAEISGYGNTVALGISNSEGDSSVEVYKSSSSGWNQIGDTITHQDSTFGNGISLSNDGHTVAITSVLGNGAVYKLFGNSWNALADDFQYGKLKLSGLGDKVLYSQETQFDPSTFTMTDQLISVYELDTQYGYITTAKIEYSTDGVTFALVNDEFAIATGITDYNSKNAIDFGTPVTARYIRIAPLGYSNIPALRLDVILEDQSVNFEDGDVYTTDIVPQITATISAIPLKNKVVHLPITGQDEQEEAYLQQDRSSIDINSEMFVRSVLLALKYVIPCFMPRHEFTKYDYEQNLKFKDPTDISSYLPLTIKEALDNEFVFANFPAIITKRNELATEGGDHIDTEDDKSLLINDVVDWWNDPTNDKDISAPVEFTVVDGSYQNTNYFNSSDTVYQDIVDGDGNNVTLEGYITDVYDNNHTLWIGWRGAINTDTDEVLPSMPQPDILFRDGVLYNNNNTATISVVQ